MGVQMQGAVWLLHNLQSPLCDVSEYTEGLWRCSEKHGVQYARSYSDNKVNFSIPPSKSALWGISKLDSATPSGNLLQIPLGVAESLISVTFPLFQCLCLIGRHALMQLVRCPYCAHMVSPQKGTHFLIVHRFGMALGWQ